MCSFLMIYWIDNNLVWLESMQMHTSSLWGQIAMTRTYEPDCVWIILNKLINVKNAINIKLDKQIFSIF